MSVRVMSWVWEHSRAEGTDRLVLLAIADCAGDDGGNAWPSVATLADKAKVSERTVQRSVKALQLLGEVTVEANAGRRGSNVYTVNLSPRQDDTPDNLTPVTVSPRQHDGVTPVTGRGDTGVTRTVLNHPTTPRPPADAGRGMNTNRRRAHCPRHVRHNSKCEQCVKLEHPPPEKPPWCGECDETTRLAGYDTATPSRCPNCHPLRKAAS